MLGLEETRGRRPDAPLHVLCLGAHADDIEIGCGGTVLRLLQERPHTAVTWVVLSGEGTPRAAEAEEAARSFLRDAAASEVQVAGFRDGYFPYQGEAVKDFFEAALKGTAPHLVFTHARDDRHQDHRVVSDLTWNTFRGRAPILEYEIPKWDGDLGRPNVYVALDEATAGTKVEQLMQCFPSQHAKAWYDAETFRGLMRVRGLEAAARYAEAFTARKLVW